MFSFSVQDGTAEAPFFCMSGLHPIFSFSLIPTLDTPAVPFELVDQTGYPDWLTNFSTAKLTKKVIYPNFRASIFAQKQNPAGEIHNSGYQTENPNKKKPCRFRQGIFYEKRIGIVAHRPLTRPSGRRKPTCAPKFAVRIPLIY